MPSLRPLQTETLSNGVVEPILPNAAQQAEFVRQLEVMVNQHKSFPSIATWVCSTRASMQVFARTLTD